MSFNPDQLFEPETNVRLGALYIGALYRKFGEQVELTALPGTGEGELTAAEMTQPTGRLPEYVVGLLSLKDEIVEVITRDRKQWEALSIAMGKLGVIGG